MVDGKSRSLEGADRAPSKFPPVRYPIGIRALELGKRVFHSLTEPLDGLIDRYSLVGKGTFFTVEEFDWTADLETNWRSIRRELEGVLEHRQSIPALHEISKTEYVLSGDDGWRAFVLYFYGYKAERNCALCPETTRLIEQIPGMTTTFFSILEPGKHIPPHRGPWKGVLRYHLALIVPRPREDCRLRVDGDTATWQEGESLIFDDRFEHEVWNETSGQRVVLFVDFLRPLAWPLSVMNTAILSILRFTPLLSIVFRNIRRTEQRFPRIRPSKSA